MAKHRFPFFVLFWEGEWLSSYSFVVRFCGTAINLGILVALHGAKACLMEEDENGWGLDDVATPHFGLILASIIPQAKYLTGMGAISIRK